MGIVIKKIKCNCGGVYQVTDSENRLYKCDKCGTVLKIKLPPPEPMNPDNK